MRQSLDDLSTYQKGSKAPQGRPISNLLVMPTTSNQVCRALRGPGRVVFVPRASPARAPQDSTAQRGRKLLASVLHAASSATSLASQHTAYKVASLCSKCTCLESVLRARSKKSSTAAHRHKKSSLCHWHTTRWHPPPTASRKKYWMLSLIHI